MAMHRTIQKWESDGMYLLRSIFPNATADYLNQCLFSTSGIHGSYSTIEDVEQEPQDEEGNDNLITYLVLHPRVLSITYGNVRPETAEDFEFLKKLRASSHEVLARIGL